MTRSQKRVTKTEAVGANGMVTAMHPLAADAGIEILTKGGNAFDAAVAAVVASGVVEPFMSGLGGAAYALAFEARTGKTHCFDGSAVAPAAATEDMFELAPVGARPLGVYGWRPTKDDLSETGFRSVAVPGALAALEKLRNALGTLSWEEILSPAIRLAEAGFPVDESLFANAAAAASRLARFRETRATFYREDGAALGPDLSLAEPERIRLAALAGTLREIAREGPRIFYEGRLAREIVSHLRENGGELSLEDLARYEATEATPLEVTYRDRRVQLFPGASGGPTVALALNVLEGFDLPSLPTDSISRLHVVAEALRIGFLDRFRFMADPRTESVPLDGLVSKRYAAERRESISMDGRRNASIGPGDPFRHSALEPGVRGGFGDAPHQHTTHVNAADRNGNLAAITATLGARFGSGVTVPGTGVVLNNGMMWFDPEPGRLNSIRPGKRALHAGAPALLFDDAGPVACLGSPGARRILSAVLQVILHLTDQRMGIQDAIEAPRIHAEAAPPLLVESHFAEEVAEGLRLRGHEVRVREEGLVTSFFGRPSGILVDRGAGSLRGGVEPYRPSAAVGI